MSREIKFRGLTLDRKQWVYGQYFEIDSSVRPQDKRGYIIVDSVKDLKSISVNVGAYEQFCCYEVIPKSVGRFTGFHDKNGKEIYFDSDVVEYTYEIDNDIEQSENIVVGTVILDLKHTNSLCVKTKGGGIYHFTAGELRNIEVIGNIHENPELIENIRNSD